MFLSSVLNKAIAKYDNTRVQRNMKALRASCAHKLTREQRGLPQDYKSDIANYWNNVAGIKPDLEWHMLYYNKCGIRDPKCIPENIFYGYIVPRMNDRSFISAYADKASYDVHFHDAKKPETIIKNINGIFFDNEMNMIDKETAIDILCSYDRSIVKPTLDSGSGKGITFIDMNKMSKANVLEDISTHCTNFIAQKILDQSPVLEQLNPSSVNTIRIMTLLWNGKVHPLSAHIRIGGEGSKYDHYGTIRPVSKQGVIEPRAFLYKVGDLIEVDNYGKKLQPITIPNYSELVATAIKLHSKCAYFKMMSWDFAMDSNDEPIMIETNLWELGINHHQFCYGGIFEEYTDEVLKYVFDVKSVNNQGVE